MIHLQLALLSGVAAALASVFAKLASGSGTDGGIVDSLVCSWVTGLDCFVQGIDTRPEYQSFLLKYTSYLRILFAGGVALSNALMWIMFTGALARAPASIQVTTMNTAANMSMTGLMSMLLFNENLSLQWWLGIGLIVAGSILMNIGESSKDKKD